MGTQRLKRYAAMILAATAISVQSQSASAYERLLIPLLIPETTVEGAYGSLWATELVIRNESGFPTKIFQSICVFECRPPIPSTACTPGEVTAAHSAFRGRITPDDSGVNPGIFLHVDDGGDLAMNLRVFERSRGVSETGVEVPIVRESEIVEGTTWLVNVPNRPLTTRAHLRLYFVSSPTMEGDVRVRVYRGDTDIAGADVVLRAIGSSDAGGVPLPGEQLCVGTPAYAMLFLTPFLDGTTDSIRVRIDSLTPDLRYWPMISTTSNETQSVTLNTPQ